MRRSPVGIVLLALIATACGDGGPITLDPVPATTTSVTPTVDVASPTTEPPQTETAVPDFVAGREWTDATSNLTGMESYCGNLAFISARPGSDEVLTGVAGQGLFVNRPDSSEWIPYARESSAPLDHRTSSIVYDPDDPDRFWESGYFGLGPPPDPKAADINRTDDGGKTFVALGSPVPTDLVSIDFTDPARRTLLAGSHRGPELFVSRDGGQTWSDLSARLPGGAIGEASFPHVVDSQTFLLGAHKGAAAGIFRSTDGGETWTRVFDRPMSGPPLRSSDGNLYWVMNDGGIVSSPDDGLTWEPLPSGAPTGGERRGRIVELDDGTWITMGVEFMIVSRDRGQTWRTVGPPLPYAPAGFTYSATRGAVFAWENYCDFEAGPNPVLAESIIRLDLEFVTTRDPADDLPSPTTEPAGTEPAAAESPAPDVAAGGEWVDATANLDATESWCGNVAYVSARPGTDQLIAGVPGRGLFVNSPDSPGWVPLGTGLSALLDHRTSSIVYDPDEPDRFWETGFVDSDSPPDLQAVAVNRTDNGGQNFVAVGGPVPADLISVDFTDAWRATLVVGAHDGPQVYRSGDGGQTWVDISSGLPSGAIGTTSFPLVIDPQTYLVGSHMGAESGIFRTSDSGLSWTRVFDRAVSGPPLRSNDGNLYWVLDEGGVVSSPDNGQTWTATPGSEPTGGQGQGHIVELDDGTWVSMGVESMIVSRDRGQTWGTAGPPLPYQPAGFTYSPIRNAAYAWQNSCDPGAGPNTVGPESIVQLDLDVTP